MSDVIKFSVTVKIDREVPDHGEDREELLSCLIMALSDAETAPLVARSGEKYSVEEWAVASAA